MTGITQMNREIFTNNLMATVKEIQDDKNLSLSDYRFLIEAVKEKDKPLNSADDLMRLILRQENRHRFLPRFRLVAFKKSLNL